MQQNSENKPHPWNLTNLEDIKKEHQCQNQFELAMAAYFNCVLSLAFQNLVAMDYHKLVKRLDSSNICCPPIETCHSGLSPGFASFNSLTI